MKFRPATQANVGVSARELDEREVKPVVTPEPVKEEVKENPVVERVLDAEAITAVNLRSKPDLSADIVKTLLPGNKIQVVSYNSNWYKVVNYNGGDCYVLKEFISVK